tara:strand:+ start:1662 stop:2147 length:486 start_codon:yes stop_codon:yes gene_type:complete
MAGRFLSTRDNNFFHKVNKELLGDSLRSKEGIINQEVTIYQIDERETSTDMYGESASGKSWRNGVTLKCLIDAEDFDFNTDEFGPDKRQNATFSFLRDSVLEANIVISLGDVINWNYAYFTISSLNENQLIGGMQDQNFSVIATGYLTRLSSLGIEQVRAF